MNPSLWIVIYENAGQRNLEVAKDEDGETLFWNSSNEAQEWAQEHCAWDSKVIEWSRPIGMFENV
jgi:hypothetical protein